MTNFVVLDRNKEQNIVFERTMTNRKEKIMRKNHPNGFFKTFQTEFSAWPARKPK